MHADNVSQYFIEENAKDISSDDFYLDDVKFKKQYEILFFVTKKLSPLLIDSKHLVFKKVIFFIIISEESSFIIIIIFSISSAATTGSTPVPTRRRRNLSAPGFWVCVWPGMRGTTACCTKKSISATHRGRSPTRTSPVRAA